jgi:hypothetical protein
MGGGIKEKNEVKVEEERTKNFKNIHRKKKENSKSGTAVYHQPVETKQRKGEEKNLKEGNLQSSL